MQNLRISERKYLLKSVWYESQKLISILKKKNSWNIHILSWIKLTEFKTLDPDQTNWIQKNDIFCGLPRRWIFVNVSLGRCCVSDIQGFSAKYHQFTPCHQSYHQIQQYPKIFTLNQSGGENTTSLYCIFDCVNE